MMTSHALMLDFAGSILYVAALLGDRPRSIDHYIDYFGTGTERAGRSGQALATRLAICAYPALTRIGTDRRQRHLSAPRHEAAG